VRISDAGLKRAARGCLEMQDAKKSPKIAIWAPSHNFVGLYLRKRVKQQYVGYNSAESEPIWIRPGALYVHIVGG